MQIFILLNKETSRSNFLITVLSETINESGNALAFLPLIIPRKWTLCCVYEGAEEQ